MGQNVNYLLGNQQTMLGADPELYRQQLIQQEQQRIAALPAQSQLGAQLGTLLGRGLVNVAQDRGFFEVTNPVLQNLTKIQGVYNSAMQNSDPNDPLSFYKNLQTGFAEAGLGQQALMATQELRRVQSEMDKAKGDKLKLETAQIELYTKNPDKLMSDIAQLRKDGDDTKANELSGLLGKITLQQDTQRAKDLAEIALRNAQTEAQRASAANQLEQIESGKYDWKVITNAAQIPVSIAKIDKKTGATTYEAIPPEALGSTATTTAPKANEKKPSISGFNILGIEPFKK